MTDGTSLCLRNKTMSNEKVKVVIPWRADASRKPGFDWVCAYYRSRLGSDCIHVSPSPAGPFNRSAAINAGVCQFPDHKIIIADADCFICDFGLKRALNEVTNDLMIIPHNRFVPCNFRQKYRLLKHDPTLPVRANWWKTRRQRRSAGAGIWVVTHDFFMESPMDERFIGWGCEDTEYVSRSNSLRFGGPLYHILHARPNKKHFKRNKRLRRLLIRSRDESRNMEKS